METVRIVIPMPPVTKKNSQQIFRGRDGRPFIAPSAKYRAYERAAGYYLPRGVHIAEPVNVRAVFYMPTRRRVDLVNLEEALCDLLVAYGVIEDDNSRIVASMDGSRVSYDKDNPRTEAEITGLDSG